MKNYILNLETNKIELHFEKSEYMSLPDDLKKELQRYFLFAKSIPAWVSRSTKNHYWAIQTAKKLGFTEEKREGKRLSYAEQLERKAEKAEFRAERYETYSDNALKRAENLQAEMKSYHGDISFFTQPNINSSKGRAFTNYRNRVFERYGRSFDEYRKSEYFNNKADTARATADMKQLKNPVYLNNRIEECNKNIRIWERQIVSAEEKNNQERIRFCLEKIDVEVDKLGFFENCMDEVKSMLEEAGKKLFTKEDIKKGYLIRTRFNNWAEVVRVNSKTVTAIYKGHPLDGFECQPKYAEIREVKIPEGWKENSNSFKNPFIVGDILTRSNIGGNRILKAYQVVNITNKTISIREINVTGNKPVLDDFISDKLLKRTVKKDRNNSYVVNDSYGDWYLYKYIAGAV